MVTPARVIHFRVLLTGDIGDRDLASIGAVCVEEADRSVRAVENERSVTVVGGDGRPATICDLLPGLGDEVANAAGGPGKGIGEAFAIGGDLEPWQVVASVFGIAPNGFFDGGGVELAADDGVIGLASVGPGVDPIDAGLGISPNIGCSAGAEVFGVFPVPIDGVDGIRAAIGKDNALAIRGEEGIGEGTGFGKDGALPLGVFGVETHESDFGFGIGVVNPIVALEPGEASGGAGELADAGGDLGGRNGGVFFWRDGNDLDTGLEDVVTFIFSRGDDEGAVGFDLTGGIDNDYLVSKAGGVIDIEVVDNSVVVDGEIHGAPRASVAIGEVEAHAVATAGEVIDAYDVVAEAGAFVDGGRGGIVDTAQVVVDGIFSGSSALDEEFIGLPKIRVTGYSDGGAAGIDADGQGEIGAGRG